MTIRLLICLAAGTLFFPLIFGCITVPLRAAPEQKLVFHGDTESEFWVCGYQTPEKDSFDCVPFQVFMNYYLGLQSPTNPVTKL
jgi:hypothetical protein